MIASDALLIVFGNLGEEAATRVSGNAIYNQLIENGVWFTPRMPPSARAGMPCIFYQSGRGFRGIATISEIGTTDATDRQAFRSIPLQNYPIKLVLSMARTFERPRDPRPLLADLSFVNNKTYWGNAFRNSPRVISMADYRIIVKSQKAS